MTSAIIILVAWLIEITAGWPDAINRRIKHPVVWIGWLIALLDDRLNQPANAAPTQTLRTKQLYGAVSVILVVGITTLLAVGIVILLPSNTTGYLVQAIIASSLLASRSLYQHVNTVAVALKKDGIDGGRTAVSHIVGRDTAQLDDSQVASATLESLAENTSDGVIAPLFWGTLLGLPGIAAYKAINTLDSMIGHRTERHEAFGLFAARLDDLVNLIPARLCSMLFLVAGNCWSLASIYRDAQKHRSPNAGWPESAMAYALGIRLSGPRRYGNTISDEPWINEAGAAPLPAEIERGLQLYTRMLALTAILLAITIMCSLVGRA